MSQRDINQELMVAILLPGSSLSANGVEEVMFFCSLLPKIGIVFRFFGIYAQSGHQTLGRSVLYC